MLQDVPGKPRLSDVVRRLERVEAAESPFPDVKRDHDQKRRGNEHEHRELDLARPRRIERRRLARAGEAQRDSQRKALTPSQVVLSVDVADLVEWLPGRIERQTQFKPPDRSGAIGEGEIM